MESLRKRLEGLVADPRAGAVHVAFYVALVQCGGDGGEAFCICREEVMRLAKIRGRTTYYKTLRELAAWGHVVYLSRRSRYGSKVSLSEPGFAGLKD
jgi:hypothetical protein